MVVPHPLDAPPPHPSAVGSPSLSLISTHASPAARAPPVRPSLYINSSPVRSSNGPLLSLLLNSVSISTSGEREEEPESHHRRMGMRPGWVGALVEESFFVGCPAHESRKKNEKNILCLGCCASICTHCLPAHRHHPLIQVSNY
jgi:hypothetical protein